MDVLASSQESTENDGTSTGTTGVLSAIGGAINGVVGKGIGALATAGLGLTISKVIERQRQDSITALNQIGLNRKDIEVFISYKKNLVSAFIEGVNKLADEDASLILGFDTFEKVPAHVSQWLRRDIIPNLNSRILVFICGRERITNDSTWSDLSGMINPIRVGLFSNEEASDYLKKNNIKDKERIDWIINFTGCLPWALALTVDFVGAEGKLSNISRPDDFDVDIIGEKVVGRFLDDITDENLKRAVYLCATTNYFNYEMFAAYFQGIESSEVLSLFRRVRKFSFTRNLDSENYAVHDVVSGFLLRGLKRFNMREYKDICSFLCSYYKNTGEASHDAAIKAKSAWEYIFHLAHINESEALRIVDNFLVDSVDSIPLDIMEEYLYVGLKNLDYSTPEGKLYSDFGEAQGLYTNGKWNDATNIFKGIIPQAKSSSRIVLVECSRLTLADIYLGQGHYAEVRDLLESLMADVQTLSFTRQKKVDARLNEVYGILGQYGKGEKLALRSKAESESVGDTLGIAWALKSLGDIYRLWGKQERSIQSFVQAISIFKRENNAYGEAVAKTQLARDYIHIGRWDEAEKLLSASDAVYQQYGYKYGIANVILFRGNIYRLQHKWDEALECYKTALNMHTEIQSWREISPIWGSMGVIYYHLGDKDTAMEYLTKSIKLKKNQGYVRGVMFSRMYLGDCYFIEQNWDFALATYVMARSEIGKAAKPIYVCSELDLKIFLCRLAKGEFTSNDAQLEYTAIEKKLSSNHYNHLVALLEFEMIVFRNNLHIDSVLAHAQKCIKAANSYNEFLSNDYHEKLTQLFDSRFDKNTANELLAQLQAI